MNPISNYISSLQKNKPSYGNLFGSNQPTSSLNKFLAPTPPAVKQPTTSPVVANNPASTPATPVNTTSTAKEQYMNTVSNTPPATPPYTQKTSTYVGPEYRGANYTGPLTLDSQPSQGTLSSDSNTTKDSSFVDAYRDYLSQYSDSLKSSDEVKAARQKLADIQNVMDIKSLEARKAYEDALNKPGMLKSGAQESAAFLNKDNSYILANLGVAESGAARNLEALTGEAKVKSDRLKTILDLNKPIQVGDSYIDPTTGKIIYEKSGAGIIGEYEYAKKQGYKGSFIDYQNEDANRKLKATGTGGSISPYSAERSARTVQSVDELSAKALENPEIFGRSAALKLAPWMRSDAFRNFESELNTLKASIAFNELTAMREASKTGGALGNVSNIELNLLESALGALSMTQSPENFVAQLQKIKESINRWNTATGATNVNVSNLPQQMELNGQILNLQADGTYE